MRNLNQAKINKNKNKNKNKIKQNNKYLIQKIEIYHK